MDYNFNEISKNVEQMLSNIDTLKSQIPNLLSQIPDGDLKNDLLKKVDESEKDYIEAKRKCTEILKTFN